MQKFLALSVVIGSLLLAGFGCNKPAVEPVADQAVPKIQTTEISYYISPNGPDDKLKYCNGADMDSEGYRKTLTKLVTTTVEGILSDEALINKTLNLAAQAAGFSPNPAENEDYLSLVGGAPSVKQLDGWAGVSIFLCAWQPFVERNLELLPKYIGNIPWKINPITENSKNFFICLTLDEDIPTLPCDWLLRRYHDGFSTSSFFLLSPNKRYVATELFVRGVCEWEEFGSCDLIEIFDFINNKIIYSKKLQAGEETDEEADGCDELLGGTENTTVSPLGVWLDDHTLQVKTVDNSVDTPEAICYPGRTFTIKI